MEEKQTGLIFLIIGSVAVVLAVVFFFLIKSNPSFFKGAAIPLIAIGLLQGIVGYTIYSRSDKQRKDIAYQIGLEPISFVKSNELPRMEKVMKNFTVYKIAEIVLLIIGIGLILYYNKTPDKVFWKGLGTTLAIMAIIGLIADFYAEKRAKGYTAELQKFIK